MRVAENVGFIVYVEKAETSQGPIYYVNVYTSNCETFSVSEGIVGDKGKVKKAIMDAIEECIDEMLARLEREEKWEKLKRQVVEQLMKATDEAEELSRHVLRRGRQ